MAKGKAYELAIKIAGRVDSSLKKACLDADENLGQLAKTAEKIGKAAKVAAGVTAAAATAVGVAAVKSYTEHEQAVNSMAAATGAAGEELDNLQGAMEAVYKNNFGENLQDAADAVATVDRNLKNISPDEIQEATEAALALRDTFEYGVEESTRAAAAITKNFGGSAKEAFSLIAAGAQNGLDYSGELIDTINEYSSQFSKLGFTADGMFQLLQSGADSTAWNLDKVGDAIKEFSIRAIDGSDTTVQAFQDLGYNADAMMETFAGGGEDANKAFFDVLNTLMDMDDQVKRDALGVALFGTMWEDLGAEAMQAMADASTAAYDTKGALDQINSVRYNDLESAMQGVKRQAEGILWTIGEQLEPYILDGLNFLSATVIPNVQTAVEKLGGYVKSNIIPTIKTAAQWIGENKDMLLTLAGAVATAAGAFVTLRTAGQAAGAIKGIGTVLGTAVKQGGLLKTVVGLLGGKFTIIIAIIAAVAGAFVILWNRSEKFRTAAHGDLAKGTAAHTGVWQSGEPDRNQPGPRSVEPGQRCAGGTGGRFCGICTVHPKCDCNFNEPDRVCNQCVFWQLGRRLAEHSGHFRKCVRHDREPGKSSYKRGNFGNQLGYFQNKQHFRNNPGLGAGRGRHNPGLQYPDHSGPGCRRHCHGPHTGHDR